MLVQSLRNAPLPGCEFFSFSELCEEYACALGREDETCVFTLTCAFALCMHPQLCGQGWRALSSPVPSSLTSVRKPLCCQSLGSYPVLGPGWSRLLRLSH